VGNFFQITPAVPPKLQVAVASGPRNQIFPSKKQNAPRGAARSAGNRVTGSIACWKPLANTHARRAAGNEIEDEHRSAAAARLSEINLANYRVFA
jgi:hypothetical protein